MRQPHFDPRWRLISVSTWHRGKGPISTTAPQPPTARCARRWTRPVHPSGPLDSQIAAHALALGVTLVSNNIRDFARVPGLRLANWAGA